MPYFDFHVHPALKPQMSVPAQLPSPWEMIRIRFKRPNLITALLRCNGINEVVDSQASLAQLIQGKVNLIAIALHPPETAMMNDGLIQRMAEEEQTQFIDLARITDIGSGDIYYRMLNEEIFNLENNLQLNGKKLKLIKSIDDYKWSDNSTICAILTIEGPHAFFSARQHRPQSEIFLNFWGNFEEFTTAHRIFSLNIAHLQDNDFCNHAYGIQIFKPAPFFPNGNGITQHGFRLLQRMKEKSILLDIKHMSLYARKQLYDYRIAETEVPIICTHAGLTGISVNDRGRYIIDAGNQGDHLAVKFYKPSGYLPGTSFNASTVNLYDEDVREIIFSGGMIGLSLDQRILGTPAEWMMGDDNMGDLYEEEFISPAESGYFLNVVRSTPDNSDIIMREDITQHDKQDWPRFHARHFLNHVFHLFKIADKFNFNKAVMAKLICIGSDFDGMINPVDSCRNVTQFDKFKKYLIENFLEWETDFTEVTGIRISNFISPEELLENIFYKNGVDFLKQWYK